jgi:hypothetical protein
VRDHCFPHHLAATGRRGLPTGSHGRLAVARLGIAFDESVRRNWLRAGIAFVRESAQLYGHFRAGSCHNLIGDTNGLVLKGPGPEVRMERYGASDEVGVIRGIGIDRCVGYIGTPQTGGWEGYESIQTRELANGHSTAGSGLRKCATAKQNHCDDGEDETSIQMVSHRSSSQAARAVIVN